MHIAKVRGSTPRPPYAVGTRSVSKPASLQVDEILDGELGLGVVVRRPWRKAFAGQFVSDGDEGQLAVGHVALGCAGYRF